MGRLRLDRRRQRYVRRGLLGRAWRDAGWRSRSTLVVAEEDCVASISLWDGTVTGSGNAVDFQSANFLRIEHGVAAKH